MAKEAAFKKTSVFICTNEELIEALRKKQRYQGLAEAIISGREIPPLDFTETSKEDLAI